MQQTKQMERERSPMETKTPLVLQYLQTRDLPTRDVPTADLQLGPA